ncbi:MAG: hypothetical protein NDP13_03975 [Crenarchaeota archaeon]|nr:hypothetical protein [Thermoproteota archaeon]MCR8454129.1 hypothetical protein [Thermoproteota archaeon]MCR8455510.1 hypothetical protein [Thermoproteota archaeon]MCR8471274.1 hypothetical protein [Thermoproteota archaeon]MCR8471900.1 hypothetical protein [Thermoproteota archaeon]
MAYGKQQLRELSQKLSSIKERMSTELSNYWWLSQGEEAVVSVRKLTKNKRLEIFETPKLSIKAALKVLIENIGVIESISGSEFYRAMSILEEDISRVTDAYRAIQDANSLIEEIENTKRMLKRKGLDSTKEREVEEELNMLVKWIRDIIVDNFNNWNNKKEKIVQILSKMKEHVKVT